MLIQSKRVWIAGQFITAQIEIEQQSIKGIYPYGSFDCDIDYGNNRILPGFIDIHTHGAYGYDTNDGEPEGLRHWMSHIPEEGVTSILPTTVTQLPDVLTKAVANVADVIETGYEGAEILGIHFEGPYLDMDYKGAQPPEAIAVPSVEQFRSYQEAAKGWIKYITLSPEHDENFALTHYCSQNGIVVSMGHSSSSYSDALMAIANGAASMTHVYNGMTPLHHRNPGLVGTALRVRDIYGEVIADGHHSHTAALNVFFQGKGRDYAIMITDSLRAKYGRPGAHYQLGGHDIEIDASGLARLSGTDTIAGSTLRMNQGLRILIEEAGVPVDAAINACTINPARCLHVDDRKGKICAGYDADLVVLEDDYSVQATYCRGRKYEF
ncbi:MAG: N-acetylglucosamine-6-phosphate deacetylase [Eubacteriales bacterium]|nr:N-acetylglucosamine-6-phosphate deacetylase [Eubacteriales bacterium]